MCPAQRIRAEATLCLVTLRHAGCDAHRTRSAFSAVVIYTRLTFQCGHLFCHCQPREVHTVNSAVTSLRFGEIDSLASITLGKGEREKPQGSGNVEVALGRRGFRLPERGDKSVTNWFYDFPTYLVGSWFLGELMLAYYTCMQCEQPKLPDNHVLHQGQEGVHESMRKQLPVGRTSRHS